MSLLVIALALVTSQPVITEASVVNNASSDIQADGKEEVVLTFLKIADELEAQAFVDMVKEFQTIEDGKWSHVTVEYDTKPWEELFPAISRAIATGSDVDIIQADGPNVKSFAYNGILADLTDDSLKKN